MLGRFLETIRFFPFFYFQHTRLNTRKSWGFQILFEWLPGCLLLLYYLSDANLVLSGVGEFLLCYLAFISIYEIGYLVNDQQAHKMPNQRIRSPEFSNSEMIIFILIRLAVFLLITFYLRTFQNESWWIWYAVLIVIFFAHNFLKIDSLKVVTFSYLAFVRYFSPFFVLIDAEYFILLAMPVYLNYVLFRAFIYMDSKHLLASFERRTNRFRLGYYLIISSFSVVLSHFIGSLLPVYISCYYFLISVLLMVLYKGESTLNYSQNDPKP